MGECLECGEWVGNLPPAHSGGSGIIRAFGDGGMGCDWPR